MRDTKYWPLVTHLKYCGKDEVTLTFKEIEQILGFKLPASARKHNAIWSNTYTLALPYGWLLAGYKTHHVDIPNEIVHFVKDGVEPEVEIKKPVNNSKNLMPITNENLNRVHELVLKDEKYGQENDVITQVLKAYPKNDNFALVAMKIALIDITNSTHISQHKQKVSIADLANIIVNIKDIDQRIEDGDPEVVNEIARTNGEINLFSFASKYCCYHNHNLYGKDDFAIMDTVLKKTLPLYFDDIRESDIERWRINIDYKSYNDYITRKLDELGINVESRKRKFDHFVWYLNR